MLLMCVGCLAFAAMGVDLLSVSSTVNHVIAWLGIVFFGCGGLVLLFWLLKERLTGRPFLTITEESVICNSLRQYVIRFADVESFVLLGGKQEKLIGIHFKKGVEREKLENASIFSFLARKYNLAVSGTQESISVTGVSIKAQELCNLLNERVKQYKAHSTRSAAHRS